MLASVALDLERLAGAHPSYRLLDSPDPDGRPRAPRSRVVVCGVEGGESSREAARVAAELSEHLAARLVLVHVAPIPVVPGTAAVPGAAEDLRRLAAERARGLLTGLLANGRQEARAERRVAFGLPAAELEAVARQEGADLIVVGSSGRSTLASALLGSVATSLARSAPCPVVVVGRQARRSGRAATADEEPNRGT